jgi:DNA-binding XRE family transcriptional regulator
MVRKYLVAARRGLRMTQAQLANAVGVTRNTIIKLESGIAVGEGIEGAVERLLGWDLGSLDAIRNGGRPMIAAPGGNSGGGLYARERRDEVEEAMWSVDGASDEQKYAAIFKRRMRMAREQQDGHQLGQTGG